MCEQSFIVFVSLNCRRSLENRQVFPLLNISVNIAIDVYNFNKQKQKMSLEKYVLGFYKLMICMTKV